MTHDPSTHSLLCEQVLAKETQPRYNGNEYVAVYANDENELLKSDPLPSGMLSQLTLIYHSCDTNDDEVLWKNVVCIQ